MVSVERGTEIFVTTKLASVISRVNMIFNCLPDDLHFYMNNVNDNVTEVLIELGCNINISNNNRLTFLDKVSLYTELSNIYKDLNECIMLTYDNTELEFAFNNVQYIMEKMAEYDSVFRYCYNNNVKKRLLTV